MLTCIPPKSSGDIYVGVSSGYKPLKVTYGDELAKSGHEITYYQQPYDASQAYQQGDLVEKDGKIYRSNKNDNVWSPETRLGELWSEIAELGAEKNFILN